MVALTMGIEIILCLIAIAAIIFVIYSIIKWIVDNITDIK